MRARALVLAVLAAAVVGAAAARTTVPAAPVPANATDANSTATAKAAPDAAAAGCGFLWLFPCKTKKVVVYCRCSGGCRVAASYKLGFDTTNGCYYCRNCAYNYGSTCTARWSLRFNAKATFTIKNDAKYTVNGVTYTPNRYTDFSEIRIEPGRCNGY